MGVIPFGHQGVLTGLTTRQSIALASMGPKCLGDPRPDVSCLRLSLGSSSRLFCPVDYVQYSAVCSSLVVLVRFYQQSLPF